MLMTPKPISLDATSFLKLTTLPVPPHIQLLNGHFLSDSTNSNGILHLPLQTCCLRDFSSFSPSLGIKTLASPLMSVSLSLHLPCPGYWSIKYTCSGVIILRPMDWNRQDIYLVHSCHCYALDCTLYCRNFLKFQLLYALEHVGILVDHTAVSGTVCPHQINTATLREWISDPPWLCREENYYFLSWLQFSQWIVCRLPQSFLHCKTVI